MTSHDDHFDAFEPHTLLKHSILDAYLIRWALKILRFRRHGARVCYVDGFAGAGHDKKGNLGSPAIACRIAAQIRAILAPEIPEAHMAIVVVEARRLWFDELTRYLEPFARSRPEELRAFKGDVNAHLDAILAFAGTAPTFFFLDPFGIKGLDAAAFPRMLANPGSEIFALFSHIGAARLRRVIQPEDSDLAARLARTRIEPALFPELDEREQTSALEEYARRQELRAPTAKKADQHLTRAVDDPAWQDKVEGLSNEEAGAQLLEEFCDRLRKARAEHVLVLPIRDENGVEKHCLIHASKSRSGAKTMKEEVSRVLNKADTNAGALLRTQLSVDVGRLADEICAQFAGRTMSWSNDGDGESVKSFALRVTAIFGFQCNELKTALRERGVLAKVSKRDTCRFAAASSRK